MGCRNGSVAANYPDARAYVECCWAARGNWKPCGSWGVALPSLGGHRLTRQLRDSNHSVNPLARPSCGMPARELNGENTSLAHVTSDTLYTPQAIAR
jgi:hypothetical protein